MTWFEELCVLAFAVGEIRSSGGSLPTFKGEPLDTWLARAAAKIERETLPRPMFEDGAPVQFGDAVCCDNGDTFTVDSIEVMRDGWFSLSQFSCSVSIAIQPGERVKRPEQPDTWERIEADAARISCEEYPDCCTDEVKDIVRRCKALAGVE